MKVTLSHLSSILKAQSVGDAHFSSVGTDSRHIVSGQLFVALRGENFDGHQFSEAAMKQGAVAALVDEAWWQTQTEKPAGAWLVVKDTRLSLGQLAAWWRSQFQIPVIGVTGSNGKTTLKEMCASILGAAFGQNAVLATQGNLNNDIGMPLTLLRLRSTHRAAVVEMGMNHPGEIAYLTCLATPTVAIVNNAQRAHLEGMGGLKAVAKEKGQIYAGLPETGVAVFNTDDTYAALWQKMAGQHPTLSFGLGAAAQVQALAQAREFGYSVALKTPVGNSSFDLRVPGVHNVRNAAGAAAACLAAGISLERVAEGLSHYQGVKGRLQLVQGRHAAQIIDDTYNANPDSMRAGIDVLAATPGRKILVMGDMGEVGETGAQLHDEIGGYAKSRGIDWLFALGPMSAIAVHNFGEGGQHFSAVEPLVKALIPVMDEKTTVLVKGSRFMRMERVVEKIAADGSGGAH